MALLLCCCGILKTVPESNLWKGIQDKKCSIQSGVTVGLFGIDEAQIKCLIETACEKLSMDTFDSNYLDDRFQLNIIPPGSLRQLWKSEDVFDYWKEFVIPSFSFYDERKDSLNYHSIGDLVDRRPSSEELLCCSSKELCFSYRDLLVGNNFMSASEKRKIKRARVEGFHNEVNTLFKEENEKPNTTESSNNLPVLIILKIIYLFSLTSNL